MDFTQVYKQSIAAFSPGSQFILAALHDRLVVRRADSFQIVATWHIQPTSASKSTLVISHIGWSCDSEYILAACAAHGLVYVCKLQDEAWNARIEAGAEGLVKAEWAPDGRSIVCTSEWGLRITIWSLITGTAIHIQYPVHSDSAYTFRADGRYFALAERHKSKDTLGVYDALNDYNLVRVSVVHALYYEQTYFFQQSTAFSSPDE
jgi:WD40 repeat protein